MRTDGGAHGAFNLDAEQLELARRRCEPVGVAHHSTAIEEYDERVVAIEQIVDCLKDILNISSACIPKGHE